MILPIIIAAMGGSTAPPVDPGITYRTSEEGLVDDATLEEGSTTFGTDNTAAMQALLDLGGDADNPITIIVDGHYSIGQVEYLSYTTIKFENGCGFILRNGTNKVMFRPKNYSFTDYTTTNFYIDSVSGKGVINGNLANEGYTEPYDGVENPEANPSVVAQKKFVTGEGIIFCFALWGVENFSIKNIEIRRPRTYHMMLTRCRNFLIEGIACRVYAANFGYNNDGIHLRGNCSNGIIRNNYLEAGDDGLPVNADDVNTYHSHEFYQDEDGNLLISGPVTGITYENNEFADNNIFVLRLLSGASLIHNIQHNGLTGRGRDRWLEANKYVGPGGEVVEFLGDGSGNIGTATFQNIDVLILARAFVTGEDSDVVWGLNADVINFINVKRRVYIDTLWSSFKFFNGSIIAEVNITDYVANDLAAFPNGAVGKDIPHITVDNAQVGIMRLTRAIVSKASTENNSRLIHVKGGGIIQILYLIDCDIDDIAKLVWIEDGYVDVIILKNTSHTNASGNASIDIDSHSVQYLASEGYTGTSLSSGTVDATSSDADAPIPGGITYHTL